MTDKARKRIPVIFTGSIMGLALGLLVVFGPLWAIVVASFACGSVWGLYAATQQALDELRAKQ